MTHSRDREDSILVHAYLDGELDPANALAIERRMTTEPALLAEYRRLEALQLLLRERFPYQGPSPELRARIEAAVGIKPARVRPSWRALAASIAIAAMVSSGATWIVRGAEFGDPVRDAVVAGHIRSLMASQPVDVVSSDRHTVKPWFNGRIPEAPRVVDLARENFPLIGGRIDIVGRKPVPTLVYRRHAHFISLTAVPVADPVDAVPARHPADGYGIVRWTENGVAYWAISDVGAEELDSFVRLFRSAPPLM
jgi:anti-sigma factor RsiW